jgi:hypothetical protein
MNEQQRKYIDKRRILSAMCATAEVNGNEYKWYEMEAIADRLHRIEATLSRLAEEQCNYPVYDSAKQERLEKLALKIISDTIGCKAYTQRDPRGYCIRMYLIDENGDKWFNVWDGETTGLAW